jgi:RNA-directed DNA polymerase
VLQISEDDLVLECDKLIRKHQRYMRQLRIDDVRRERRVTLPHRAVLHRPTYWSIDAGFDPYEVKRRAAAISRAVNLALKKNNYAPRPPVAHEIPKASGGTRIVSIFQIVDSVVSKAIYRSLLGKNRALLSARSYAYRDDLSTHDAIQYIASEFQTVERIFVAEYDFSKYFDSIEHGHILRSLEDHGFLVTAAERAVINAFLLAPLQVEERYDLQAPRRSERRGIPQGTSISLFLANVAAWQIDRSLERIGVGFTRYADDTLIWARDYSQITKAVNVLKTESLRIGAELNPKKSHGVRLFTPPAEPAEIESTDTVAFVGYRFQRGRIGFNKAVVDRIHRRIESLIWANLLQALQEGTFDPARVAPPIDRDYLVLLLQIRRYLYGNFSEARLRDLERGAAKQIRFPGLLSYFPLVNDQEQLKQIDGWLASTLHLALRKRAKLLSKYDIREPPHPHHIPKNLLIGAWGKTSSGDDVDLRIPSVARFMSVLSRAATAFGANAVSRGTGAEEYQYYLSDGEL